MLRNIILLFFQQFSFKIIHKAQHSGRKNFCIIQISLKTLSYSNRLGLRRVCCDVLVYIRLASEINVIYKNKKSRHYREIAWRKVFLLTAHLMTQ